MAQFTSDISVTLDDGETERFVVDTLKADAVRVDLSADGAPYDVDIQTSETFPDAANFNAGDYTSSLPFGAETYTDTNEHTTAAEAVDQSVYVAITNNSGSPALFTGSISTLSASAGETVESFTTKGTGSRPMASRDGRALLDAERTSSKQVTPAPVRGRVSKEGSEVVAQNLVAGQTYRDADFEPAVQPLADDLTTANGDPGVDIDVTVRLGYQ